MKVMLLGPILAALAAPLLAQESDALSAKDVAAAAKTAGLSFTDDEIELMLADLRERLVDIDSLRETAIPNDLPPAQTFSPWVPGLREPGPQFGDAPVLYPRVVRPERLEDIAFWSIPELGALLRQGDTSAVELTELYLDRLSRLDERLHCVITLTAERALDQARARDAELAAGIDRGPLHGIPWGVKDLMAVQGYRTTWGAKPFEGQSFDITAEVVQRLDAAGAVLIAKLSVGALAWGDVWFGERTRNPWDPERGSSGSSAGSASATAAGGVVFALGTETLGSIVSPSVACGTCALRPTFGRVPRTGTMALSWTMDKVGPITRSVGDADLVFRAIRGAHPADPFSRDGRAPANAEGRAPSNLTIGVPSGTQGRTPGLAGVVRELEALGHRVIDVEIPDAPLGGMLLTLGAEAAAAFDELTRSGLDDELVRQVRRAWPNVFRAARLIPAVEYIQAQRHRTRLMRDLDRVFMGVDLLVHGPYDAGILQATNLTGHPTVVATLAPVSEMRLESGSPGPPGSICFTGRLDRDEELMAVVSLWERAHPEHRPHPPLDWLDASSTPPGSKPPGSESPGAADDASDGDR